MRITRRAVSACAAAAAVATPAVAAGEAAKVVQTLSVTIGPQRAGTPKSPRPASLQVTATTRAADGSAPPVLVKDTVWFSSGLRWNGALFPSCSVATIERRGIRACPAGSRSGRGHAVAVSGPIRATPTITVFNGPRGRSVLFYLQAERPVRVGQAVEAPFSRAGGRFSYKLTLPFPKNLQEPTPGLKIAVTEFSAQVSRSQMIGGRRRGIIETVGCPKGGAWSFEGAFAGRGGVLLHAADSVPCRR